MLESPFICMCAHVSVLFKSEDGGDPKPVGDRESAEFAAPQRMRTDDRTPQRPQATVVGDGRGGLEGGRGVSRTSSTFV